MLALLGTGCCDPFNDKALRASRGAAFKLPIAIGNWQVRNPLAIAACIWHVCLAFQNDLSLDICFYVWQGIDQIADHHNLACFGAEPHHSAEEDLPETRASSDEISSGHRGLCLVLGNEGQGLSEDAQSRCQPLTIPMAGRMESLNVSHAGAILMFALSDGAGQVIESLRHHTKQH
jgi:TrmH family RNA methyltransferase